MRPLLRLMLLPVQAPMLLLLFVVSTYLGMHWSGPSSVEATELASLGTLLWSAECLQALVLVVVCTMPDLLLRQVSNLMAASRVLSLVVTLLLVVTGGLYLLHLEVLSNVLILGSTVLLARLDLVRIRVSSRPVLMAVILSVLVLAGAGLGRTLEARYQLDPSFLAVPPKASEASQGSGEAPGASAPEQPPMPNRLVPKIDQPSTQGSTEQAH
jgi:hypothetical protein